MTIKPTNVSEGLEARLRAEDAEHRRIHLLGKGCDRCKAADEIERLKGATLSPPLPSPGVERLREALVRIEAGLRNLIARGKSPEVLKAGMSIAADEVAALSALPLDGGLK